MNNLIGFVLAFLLQANCIKASIMTADFSGIWSEEAGMIRAGDTFSGSASWDVSFLAGHGMEYAPIQAFNISGFDSYIEDGGGVMSPDLSMKPSSAVYFNGTLLAIETVTYQRNFADALHCATPIDSVSTLPRYWLHIRPGSAQAICVVDFGDNGASSHAMDYQFDLEATPLPQQRLQFSPTPEPRLLPLLLSCGFIMLLVLGLNRIGKRIEPRCDDCNRELEIKTLACYKCNKHLNETSDSPHRLG